MLIFLITMSKIKREPYEHSTGRKIAFGLGSMTDQMTHQAFQLLVFVFYYAVVGVDVFVLLGAFIIFSIWDSINDPLLGPISDRTKTRFGRRRFWVLISILPLALITLLLFTPPYSTDILNAAYMIVIIMLFDLIYTMFSSNQLALFPEMFKTERERSHANLWKNLLTIIGVILGTVLPTIIISPMVPTEDVSANIISVMYRNTGYLLAALIIIFGFLFYKFGMKEDPLKLTKPQNIPPIWKSLKMTLKNKTFLIFIFANLFNWFVFKLLTAIIPLYAVYVLGLDQKSIMLSLLLLIAFLTAAGLFPLMKKLGLKIGMRNAFMVTELIWVLALIPFGFLDNHPGLALIVMFFNGIGLSGAMYYVDIIIASIIDEDEVKNGCRREGSYYGVNALINRYSTILVFVSIAIVLSTQGWQYYLVGASAGAVEEFIFGLKLLMVVFNIVGILIVILLLKLFPLHGERWRKVQEQVAAIREKKICEAGEEEKKREL